MRVKVQSKMAAVKDIVTLVLDKDHKTTVTVHLHGATVLAWKAQGKELLFVSDRAVYDNKKAIRGGIPLVFPNFGPWALGPQHGFARISRWKLEQKPEKDDSGAMTAVFTLTDNKDTRKMWDHKFKLTYTLHLTEKTFKTTLKVDNTGAETFTFTTLLHTYFRTDDITKATVSGLKGLEYEDKVRGDGKFTEDRELVTVAEEVDRTYASTPNSHIITGVIGGGKVHMEKTNLPDTVVWNPWVDKAKAMGDFGDDEYPSMLCVEAGHVATPLSLGAGQSFTGSQTLTLMDE
ncbi:putative glucose-6-phosphate 1-epimerase [Branchiostoma floridae]|uniref:glucose-6-phosphate 1-epimerase n=2 Tax=Branchiostoma floridae TaxID=7739 RepID=A0A9J7HNI7_BRAFL|nr:putative glucose-6-phosphate 1-epimerase [Branchiostoma floridae]